MRLIAALLLLLLAAAQGNAQTVRFKKVFSGITAPATSSAMPNVGQGLHMLAIQFPTATADVAGLEVRLEASFDGASYFPISQDLATAKYNGSFAYAITRANGNYPFVRVRAVTVSATYPMEAFYTAGTYPVGNVIFDVDRFLAGGPAAGYDKATFVLCNGSPCQVGTNLTNKYIVTAAGQVQKCYIAAKTAPAGAALIVDVLKNGVSIFGASKLTLPAGSVGPATSQAFSSSALAENDVITADITQVGSTNAGQDVTVVCKIGL